jgi:hypothetical protein
MRMPMSAAGASRFVVPGSDERKSWARFGPYSKLLTRTAIEKVGYAPASAKSRLAKTAAAAAAMQSRTLF